MKKVAVVRSIFLPLSETFIYNELVNLRKTKAFVCTRHRKNTRDFPYRKVYRYRSKRHLETILRSEKANLIHARFGTAGVDVMNVKRRLKTPMLTSFHGSDLPSNKRRSKSYRRKLKKLFRFGEAFTVPSKNLRKTLVKYGCSKKKIHVQYSGIDVREFSYKKRSIHRGERIVILSVGRLVEKKGMKYLIRAFSRVEKEFPHVELRIAGDGPLRKRLVKMAEKKGLRHKVHFLGALTHEEVRDEMRRAHLFVLASIKAKNGNQEGIPNVLKEAMACGLPVVSTWHSGIPELVEHKKTGYLVEERDKKALAQAILKLIRNPEQWEKMGEKGRKKVVRKFNISKQAKKLEKLYSKLAK
ncbi:glycosyltransferase [Ammoniphilus sp. YIM 78166]|uniref:glycosyltransferase n=1 Tax=Ammoniphilus sp. YIM 78166 TaxID=1644106 RepID=UPI00106FFEB6|nr:glycosyltransferase [Ammoniphilus sp. YIM 78166]